MSWTPIKLKPNPKHRTPVREGWYPWDGERLSADTTTGPLTKKQADAECARRNILPTKLLTVKGIDGRDFNVRLVSKGGAYGLNNCLTHTEDDPIVEFYDAKHAGNGFGPLGQFVSRYYRGTLLESDGARALSLQGYIPAWTIPADQMRLVFAALKSASQEASQ